MRYYQNSAPTLRRDNSWEYKKVGIIFPPRIIYFSLNKYIILNFTFTAQSLTGNFEKLFECSINFHSGLFLTKVFSFEGPWNC